MPPRAIAAPVRSTIASVCGDAGALVLAQQELQHHGRRELRRAAETAVTVVELTGQQFDRGVERGGIRRVTGRALTLLSHGVDHPRCWSRAGHPGARARPR